MSIKTELSNQWIGRELSNKRYVVEAVLGLGGMGCTFLARDRNVGHRPVVIKVIRSDVADQKVRKRFAREIRALTNLQHPRIVQIMDIGDLDGSPFIVMSYLGGGNLQDRISALSAAKENIANRLVEWLMPIADALDFVHANQMVHRDVKPQNIFFDRQANSYLGDFGITKSVSGDNIDGENLTDGSWIGTVHYMAPEQLSGKVCEATDQYALGVIAYEVLTGDYPFGSKVTPEHMVNIGLLIVDIVQKEVRQIEAEIPLEAKEAVYRALEKDPGKRFDSCTAFLSAFQGDGNKKPRLLESKADLSGGTCPSCGAYFFFDPRSSKRVSCMVCNHQIDRDFNAHTCFTTAKMPSPSPPED